MVVRDMPRWRPFARWSSLAAWGMCALCLIAMTAGLALEVANRAGPFHEQDIYPGAIVIGTLFPVVGATITARQPANLIGWVFLCMGLSEALVGYTAPYAVYAYFTHPSGIPGGALASWIATSVWAPGFSLVILVLVLFPTGRPPSRPWWVVVWLALLGTLANVLTTALNSWPERGPLLVGNNDGAPFADGSVLGMANTLSTALIVVSLVAAVVCLAGRFRGARGIVRQQMKWFAYSAVMAVVILVVSIVLLPNGGYLNGRLLDTIVAIAQGLAFAGIPVGIGIAILRYQLYDIDLIINRTLVYGSLTALLAGLYFGSVVLLQTLVRVLTGQHGESALAIVVSTLLIAALFQPLRTRLQRTIDRRFYRQKYDAAKTLAQFAATLRGEVELADLEQHLVGVVEETMRPAHVSLWLRGTENRGEQNR